MINRLEGNNWQMPGSFQRPQADKQEKGQKSLSGYQYSSDSVSLSYSDGSRSFDVSVEQTKLDVFDISKFSEGDQNFWKKAAEQSSQEFNGQFFSATSIEININISVSGAGESGANPLIDSLADEWKPEAVADRIFQFVTGFEGKGESQGGDFFSLMKDAVFEGVKQAYEQLGGESGFSDDVKGVLDETVRLLEEKFEIWGRERGFVDEPVQPGGLDISA